ncbi:MAG: MFS transporter, partial [Dehalococcoidia bacterium]
MSNQTSRAFLGVVRLPRVFYGWWIVAVAGGFQALFGALFFHGFGTFFVALQREFGWSRTLLSGAYSLARVEGGLLGPLEGLLIDRLGPRRVVLIGLGISATGFLLLSRTHNPAWFYASYLVMSLGFSLAGWLTLSTAVNNWFILRRATAMSFLSVGLSVGGLSVPLLALAMEGWGWRNTSVGIAMLILAVGIPMALVLRRKPEDFGLVPDGGLQYSSSPSREALRPFSADFTVWQAVRTRAFWAISLGHAVALIPTTAVVVHLIPFLENEVRLPLAVAASVVTVSTAVGIPAQ